MDVAGSIPVTGPQLTIHPHPLAYLLGLEGVALMQAFAGDHDAAFTQARIAEIRHLLDRAEAFGDGVDLEPMPSAEAARVLRPGGHLLP